MFRALLAIARRRQAFLRNGGTAAVLFVGADAIAQYVEQRGHASADGDNHNHNPTTTTPPLVLDTWRCLGATGLGIVLGGGVYPTAYAQLDRFFPGRSWRTVVLKSAVEVATVGLAVNTASLLGRAAWQGHHAWETVTGHVACEIPRVTLMDAQVWFPYNVLAFGWIPTPIRPLTTACMEAGWQTYISLRAHDFDTSNSSNNGSEPQDVFRLQTPSTAEL